jgi:hypothetical protein
VSIPASAGVVPTEAGERRRPSRQEADMQYMLLIYQDPNGGGPAQGTPEAEARMQEWFSYDSGLKEDGSYVSGAALQGTEEATTVRSRNGGDQLTDGPFAETKEWLAGYYVIDVPDLDGALARAKRMPNIREGSVEVRPVWEIPGL